MGPGDDDVDEVIAASWDRSRYVDPQLPGAPVDERDLAERWEQSPVRRAAGDVLVEVEAMCARERVMAGVADASGRVLWTSGRPDMRRRAERLGFVPGSVWHERVVGTNAVGLALHRRAPATVFAGEHWLERARDVVCYAAPLRLPDGSVAGALDLTMDWHRANGLGLLAVTTTAQLIDHEVARSVDHDGPEGTLRASFLGHAEVWWRGRRQPLSPRQCEIVAALSLVETAALGELHGYLYGDRAVTPTTLKVEISRLRRRLRGAVGSRPYRFVAPVAVDAVELMDHLGAGRVAEAAELYRGQLLPVSDAPLIVERRHVLDVALRSALLGRGDAASLLRYADVHPHDVTVLERAVAVTADDDPLRCTALGRLATARHLPAG